jgi:hypothetical protein
LPGCWARDKWPGGYREPCYQLPPPHSILPPDRIRGSLSYSSPNGRDEDLPVSELTSGHGRRRRRSQHPGIEQRFQSDTLVLACETVLLGKAPLPGGAFHIDGGACLIRTVRAWMDSRLARLGLAVAFS